ncbi:MAG: ABC transporter substrate-binding protein [Verrucomicrobiota bacterium]
MKKLLILILALAVFVIGCKQKAETTADQKPVVKIGVVFPLSGDLASWGDVARDAMWMARDDLGTTKFRYEFIFEDSKLDGKFAATAIQKLVNIDKVDAVISASATEANIISPIAEKNRIIHFSYAYDPEAAKGTYNFLHWTPPDESSRGLAKVLADKKLTKVALFILNHQDAIVLFKAFEPIAKEYGIQIVFSQIINAEERDFKTLIARAKQTNPDIYVLGLVPPSLDIIAKQLREQKVFEPMTCIEAFNYSENPTLFEGMWFIDAADAPDDIRENFQKKYHHIMTSGMGNGYDIVKMLAYAYEKASTSSSKPLNEEVVQILYQIKDFPGMLGKLTIDSQGIVHSKPTLKEIRNGKPIIIKRDL